MARQQSNTDLAGSLAATLTPRIPQAREMSFRAAQNSGLFDVGALYAEALDEVLRRTRSDVRLAPLARAAQPTWPRAAGWSEPVVSFDFDAAVPVAFTRGVAARSSRGIGWFGVAVAWLATVTMGASLATTLPGHALTHPKGAGWVVPATPAAPPAVSPSTLPVAPVPVAALPAVSASSLATTTVAPPALALAAPASAAPQAVSPHVSTKRLAPKVGSPPAAHGRSIAAASPAVAAAPPAIVAAHPAAPARATPASPPPASTAGMSLDDLIRHEVQAESAKHR
jgi:hypothetical protein